MKKIYILFFILSACGGPKEITSNSIESTVLSYVVQPNLTAEIPSVSVQFETATNEKGEIQLAFTNEGWDEKDLFKSVKNLKISPKANVEFLKKENEIKLKGNPNKKYKVSYEIIQDFKEKVTTENTFRPIINSNYFHVFGKSLFMMPYSNFTDDDPSVEIQILWKSEFGSYDITNSFGTEKTQKFKAKFSEFSSSIFLGGKLNSYEKLWNQNNVVLSTPDTWENVDITRLQNDLYNIVGLQRNFWKENNSETTTVTFIKTFENCPNETNCLNSCGGTGLTNSFATYCSDNFMTTNERLNWLFAHELFHHWVGSTIVNESEEIEYWFSEGFTNYFAYKLLLRSGILSLEDFMAKLNEEVIEPHYNSTLKTKPNGEINAEKFWSDKEWGKLPYRRGLLYAFYLDTKIKQNVDDNRSLDDVMRDILYKTTTNKVEFNRHVFLEVLDGYKLNDYENDYENFIEQGNPIDLTKLNITGIYFETGKVPLMHIQEMEATDKISRFLMR